MPSANVRWAVPLVRQNPWFPGQMGVPGTDTETGLRLNTLGTIFYVDPNYPGASDARDGTNPTDPLLTVAAALTKCQPYCGDVIAVMANGDWQYSGHVGRQTTIQEAVTVNVPGVRIVGVAPSSALGVYWQPPANNGVCITVNAIDVTIEGFAFWNEDFTGGTGIFAQWTGLAAPKLQGENLTVRHCFFAADLDYGIALDYAWYSYIHDNYFIGAGIAAIHNVAASGDPDYAVIYHNHFVNNALAISIPGSDDCHIYSNWIHGDPGAASSFINLTGGTRNLVADNWLGCTIAQYTGVGGTCQDGAADLWVNNHCVTGDPIANP